LAQNKNIAIIDIGSNSCRLLITSCKKLFPPILEQVEVTRISEGVYETGLLSEDAVSRTLSVIHKYIKTAFLYKSDIYIFSTSPLRLAKNPELLRCELDKLNIPFEIVSGEKEAYLNYLALKSYFKQFTIAIDLGGGSTEFIVNSSPIRLKSLDIGCVKYMELHKENPNKLKTIINNSLDNEKFPYTDKIIGIGGTATTLLSVHLGLSRFDSKKIQGSSITISELENIYENICSVNIEERKKILGMDPKRADTLPTGCFIIINIMKKLKANTLIASHLDLMYGYAISFMESDRHQTVEKLPK